MEAVARAAVVGEVEAAVAQLPGRVVVPVAAVGPARALEEREAAGERERRLLENGQQPPPCCAAKGLAGTACPEPGKVATELKRRKCARCWGCSRN